MIIFCSRKEFLFTRKHERAVIHERVIPDARIFFVQQAFGKRKNFRVGNLFVYYAAVASKKIMDEKFADIGVEKHDRRIERKARYGACGIRPDAGECFEE